MRKARQLQTSGRRYSLQQTPAIVSNILNISANILNSRFIQVANIARGVHINHQDLQKIGSRHQARHYLASSPPNHFHCYDMRIKTAADTRQEISTTANRCNCMKYTYEIGSQTMRTVTSQMKKIIKISYFK